jgi:hypothetical protein
LKTAKWPGSPRPFCFEGLGVTVMPAHSRSKNGVASLAYVAGIHVLSVVPKAQDVDGRDKPGHDEN